MSQHPQAHDKDGMVTDPTAVLEANAQEFLKSLRALYARLTDLDALLNREVELAPCSDLFRDFGSFAAVLAATPQATDDEEVIADEEGPNMVLWQEAEVQALLRSLREENVLVNAVYDTEEAIWSDSDSDENVVHSPTAPADSVTPGPDPDPDTFMTDAPRPQSLALVMRPLLSPTLPNIVEREPLGLLQTSEVLSSLVPLEGEFVHLKVSGEQEDEERG